VHATTPAPARPSTTVPHAPAVSSKPATHVTPAPHHRAHPLPRHTVAPRPTANPISLSFLLGLLPADLLRLPRAALHAGGAVSHRDGVLLLLSSVAMGVLAVSSFGLMRRLKRLEGPAR
jgi:hypothetical protein